MTPPAFCASCVEVRSDLRRFIRKGRTVWLCPDCVDPVQALRQFEISDHREREGMNGTGPLDGNRGIVPRRGR